MIKRISPLLLILLVATVSPSAAAVDEDFGDFFGVDVEAMKAEAELEYWKYHEGFQAGPVTEAPHYTAITHKKSCILRVVARKMGLPDYRELNEPEVRLQSGTPLKACQDAVERAYGYRPKAFTNIFVDTAKTIFLTDRAEFYKKGNTIDDALAHEHVHYIQSEYLGFTRDSNQKTLELQARAVQKWFRKAYMSPEALKNPCQ